MLCDELLALCQVSALVKRWHVLRLCYKAKEPQAQNTQAFHATASKNKTDPKASQVATQVR